MKKFFTLFLTLMTSVMLWAYDFQSGDLYHNITSNVAPYTVEVTSGNTKYSGDITIPSSVTYNGITYAVTGIGSQAFFQCSSLFSITIPNSVTSIGDWAFYNCSSIDAIYLENNTPITWNNSSVFSDAHATKCYVPCGSLSEYQASSWRYISDIILEYHPYILTISSDDESMGSATITQEPNCSTPAIITATPNIGYTFKKWSDGNTDNPRTLTLNNHTTLTAEFEIREGYIIFYTSTDGNIVHPRYDTGYSTNGFGANLLSNTYENGVGKMIFDAPVTSIGGAYFWRSNLTSIVIPSTVTTLERNAFYESYDLTSVSLAEGLVNINEHAFSFCRSLTTITIPNSVTYLGENVFGECYGLSSISIGSGITNINERIFQNCDALDTIYIKAVTPPIIDKYAFFDTHASICYIPCGTLGAYQTSDWGNYVDDFIEECKTNQIYYTSTDGNIVIPNKADAFGANIVSNTYENGVGTITFDGPITSIGSNAFSECSSLTSIIIPNSVTSIGSYAFSDCTNLCSLTIPKSVTSLGEGLYPIAVRVPNLASIHVEEGNPVYDSRNNCNAIIETATNTLWLGCQNTVIPNNIKKIVRVAFYGATMLKNVDIPASVESIGYGAFAHTGITKITIPANTILESANANIQTLPSGEKISFGVFGGCKQLTEVIISEGVTNIPRFAFSVCPSLNSIVISSSVSSIESLAFAFCTSLTTITIPENVSSIERCAFENCSALTDVYVKTTTPPNLVTYDSSYDIFTSSPVCHIPCGTKAAYEASAWASQVSEFVEDCDYGSYSRNVRIGYNTICLPHGSSNFTGATFYEIAHILKNNKKIFFDEVKTLEAGKPYIFYPHSNEVTVYYDNTTSAVPLSHNGLHGTFDGITAASNFLKGKYLVAGDRMVLCGDGCSLAANRAYIVLDEISDKDHPAIPGIKRVSMDYSEENATTALDNITDESIVAPMQEGVYDILGRKVDAPTVSGFYIINGKKVFIAL